MLGVRPEHVRLVDEPGALPAKIRHVEYFGSHWIADLHTPSGVIKALIDKDLQPREGDRVQAKFDTERVVLFDAVSQRLLSSATTCNHRPSVPHG